MKNMITILEATRGLPRQAAHYPGASPGRFQMRTRGGGRGMTAPQHSGSHQVYGFEAMPERVSEEMGLPDLNLQGGWAHVFETLVPAAVMEERRRMAREIHDTLAQAFSGILLHLEAAVGTKAAKGQARPAGLCRARELARSGLEDARRMLLNLRPLALESNPIAEALRQLAENFSSDGHIPCCFQVSGCESDLSLEIQDEFYRMAQEALCNVRKHSGATRASVTLDCGLAEVILRIRDNGHGLPCIHRPAAGHGYGLRMMRERARRLGGKLNIITAAGTGTQIVISVPQSGNNPKERNVQ